MSVFDTLNGINVNNHTESKNGLTYLSWAWAWGELKKKYPQSFYTVYENADGWNYFTDGRTCWVKTGVTVVDGDGTQLEHIEYLPVMDFKNKSIPADKVTSFDVNKAIQRSLTKAVARHGLGLYIYAGEDLPEAEAPAKAQTEPKTNVVEAPFKAPEIICERCGNPIQPSRKRDGSIWNVSDMAAYSRGRFKHAFCADCMKAIQKAEKEAKQTAQRTRMADLVEDDG